MSPGWPDDPDTVAEASKHPEVFARKSIGDIADHYEAIDPQARPEARGDRSQLRRAADADPRRSRALAASVAIDPAPFRGVLPLPISALRRRRPCLKNPANRHRAVPLTFDQFRYAFANAVDEDEAKALYDEVRRARLR